MCANTAGRSGLAEPRLFPGRCNGASGVQVHEPRRNKIPPVGPVPTGKPCPKSYVFLHYIYSNLFRIHAHLGPGQSIHTLVILAPIRPYDASNSRGARSEWHDRPVLPNESSGPHARAVNTIPYNKRKEGY